MTLATLAGISLIIGAFLVYRGQIFYAVMVYFVNDMVWTYLTFVERHDILGGIIVVTGALLGVASFFKMQLGKMAKSLRNF